MKRALIFLVFILPLTALAQWESFVVPISRVNEVKFFFDSVNGATSFDIQKAVYDDAQRFVKYEDVTGWQDVTSSFTVTNGSGHLWNLPSGKRIFLRIKANGATDNDYNSYSPPRMAYTGLFPKENIGISPLVNLTDYPNRTSLNENINDFVEPNTNAPYTNEFGLTERRFTFGKDELNDMPSYPSLFSFSADEDLIFTRSTDPKVYNTTTWTEEFDTSSNYGVFIDQNVQGDSYTFSNSSQTLFRRTVNATGTVTATAVHNFSNLGYSSVVNGGGDFTPSIDMNYWAFHAVDGSGNNRCIVYRMDTDSVISDFVTLDPQNGGYAISPQGTHLVINSSPRNAFNDRDVYTINGNTVAFAYTINLNGGHHDYGISAQGNDFYIYTKGSFNLFGLRLHDGKLFLIQGGSGDNASNISYISGRAIYSGGWIFLANTDGKTLPSDFAAGTLRRNSYHKNYSIFLDETKLQDLGGVQGNISANIDNQYVREYSYSHLFYADPTGSSGGLDTYPSPNKSGTMLGFSRVDYGFSDANINSYSNLNHYVAQQTTLIGDEINSVFSNVINAKKASNLNNNH